MVSYEKSTGIGGLWNYNENDLTLATVSRSTIINSSKEMSAYTDFVPPADYPNFMHNTMMVILKSFLKNVSIVIKLFM